MNVTRNALNLNRIYQVTYKDLLAIAATSGDVVIKTLPMGTIVRDVIWKPTEAFKDLADQSFTDGVFNTDTGLTSASATFVAADVGKTVTGTGIPAGTTIASRSSASVVVLSAATTLTGTGKTFTIVDRAHGVTAVTARVITAAHNYGSAALDVFQAPGDTVFTSDITPFRESIVAAVDLKVHFVSTGGNLSTLTSGALSVAFTHDALGLSIPASG